VVNNWRKEAKIVETGSVQTLWRWSAFFRLANAALKKSNKRYTFRVCICSLRSPVCPAAPYFGHYLINGWHSKTKILKIKYLFWFFLLLLSHSKNKWARYHMHIDLHIKCSLFLSYFNETSIFTTDFRKKRVNIKFHENPSSGSRFVPCGRKDRQTVRNWWSLFPMLRRCLETE